MRKNEIYWMNLYKEGKIEIDFESGIVYSYLSGKKREIGNHRENWYKSSSAGPSRKERYNILLHRLIWFAAGNDIPEGLQINHLNGNKRDNRISNLELSNKSLNALHAYRVLGKKGGVTRGEKSPKHILTWKAVDDIRENYKKDVTTMKVFAIKYGVTMSAIADVVYNRSWNYRENNQS